MGEIRWAFSARTAGRCNGDVRALSDRVVSRAEKELASGPNSLELDLALLD